VRKARYATLKLSELTPDIARVVPLGDDGGTCALVLHDGKPYAIGSLCPHQNATLSGALVYKGELMCMRHGYCFNLKTGDCTTVGGYGVPVYEIEVEDETIYVSLWEFEPENR
jgi:nitrite reductase/ring-hydroxylating ferredoxin subunit